MRRRAVYLIVTDACTHAIYAEEGDTVVHNFADIRESFIWAISAGYKVRRIDDLSSTRKAKQLLLEPRRNRVHREYLDAF